MSEVVINPESAELKGFSLSFRFICLPMIKIYGFYKYFTLSMQGSTLASESAVRFGRQKSIPAL